MIRVTARELLRREKWLAKLTASCQCPSDRLPLPTQFAAFSASRAAAADPALVEDSPNSPVEKAVSLDPALDFNSPWEAYRVRN
jgi:hypothetical protein